MADRGQLSRNRSTRRVVPVRSGLWNGAYRDRDSGELSTGNEISQLISIRSADSEFLCRRGQNEPPAEAFGGETANPLTARTPAFELGRQRAFDFIVGSQPHETLQECFVGHAGTVIGDLDIIALRNARDANRDALSVGVVGVFTNSESAVS